LKADLISKYVCRLLNHMDRHGLRQCTPRTSAQTNGAAPFIDFSSGYVQRAIGKFPRQGAATPWKAHQNYVRDILTLRLSTVEDGVMEFSNPDPAASGPRAILSEARADSLPQ